jgi:LytS/YehU family sensor histidine kinase
MPNIKTNIRSWKEHAAFWLFIFLFVFDYHFLENNWLEAIGNTLLELLTYAVVIYLNLLFLIPNLLENRRQGWYLAAMAAVVVAYILLMRLTGWESHFYEIGGWRNVFSMALNTSLFLLISTLYWFFKRGQAEREQQLVLRSEKLEAELKFLRTQISPHFIFNTLNNVYSLALDRHENAAPMVAKLSGILRYVLYEGAGGQVFLKKEMEVLRQYVELFLLKKARSQNVDFFVEGNPNAWQIAPMLLLNIVENALKHSHLEQDESAWVKIHAEILEDGSLVFSAANSTAAGSPPGDAGGVGLPNLRRHLEINYPASHSLELKNEGQVFSVVLRINLKKS